ncbi:hypothetical protein L226DRAFT_568480 [Lentinus tigrinus ALCF2SS1-7]|uniref:uncharacterized protein n=1 Tax=Lentinus tigrinus ALCF2SS1-7 TaxID=1328758 RepID=UPI001165CE70|nr:hypothetical protein L226DRAFT_568480 [Lentinus tigrinus ALCF2SS1-7]
MALHATIRPLVRILLILSQVPAQLKRALTKHSYLVACAGGTVALVIASIISLYTDAGLGFYQVVPVFRDLNPLEGVNNTTPAGLGFGLQIANADVPSNSLSVNWWPIGCNQRNQLPAPQWLVDSPSAAQALTDLGCNTTPESYEIWVDLSPYWSWNATANVIRKPGEKGRIVISGIDTFNTSHQFSTVSPVETWSQRRQFSLSAWYPFDRYSAATFLEAFDSTNRTALPIYFAHIYGGATGFDVSVTVEPVTTVRSGSAVLVTFSIRRGTAVRLFAIALNITNYVLTIGMVCIAVGVGMGRRMPDSVLILPLTNILALPQLRAAMPDAPDFGVFLDISCYEVNLLAVVFAAMFIMTKITTERWLAFTPKLDSQ